MCDFSRLMNGKIHHSTDPGFGGNINKNNDRIICQKLDINGRKEASDVVSALKNR
ncbi:MAG: hypothetical protein AAFQ94_02840 [Bacteroidota bacterium]